MTQFEGTFVQQGDARYDELRVGHMFNRRITTRQPPAVLLAADEDDVVSGVRLAAQNGWQVSVRAGGHSWANWGIRDNALLIDVGAMKDMQFDPSTNIASVTPAVAGATELDSFLAERGRFFPVGHCESVGLGGFLLQGGQGWHVRHYGWSCESIESIDAVLADGSKVRASEEENSDLFWVARGAGPGFPGVVTRFNLKTYPRPALMMDTRSFRLDALDELLAWLQRILPTLDSRVEPTLVATGLDVPLAEGVERPAGTVLLLHTTAVGESEGEITPLLADFDACPVQAIGRVRAVSNIPEQNRILGESNPEGFRWAADTTWTDASAAELAPALRKMWAHLPTKRTWSIWYGWTPRTDLPDMALSIEGLANIAVYCCYESADDDERMAEWVHNNMGDLAARFGKGVYIGDTDFSRRPDRFVSDENFVRVEKIRRKWDPTGLFCGWLINDNSKINIH
jgi:FAD/FMN-containing dehydrogenase